MEPFFKTNPSILGSICTTNIWTAQWWKVSGRFSQYLFPEQVPVESSIFTPRLGECLSAQSYWLSVRSKWLLGFCEFELSSDWNSVYDSSLFLHVCHSNSSMFPFFPNAGLLKSPYFPWFPAFFPGFNVFPPLQLPHPPGPRRRRRSYWSSPCPTAQGPPTMTVPRWARRWGPCSWGKRSCCWKPCRCKWRRGKGKWIDGDVKKDRMFRYVVSLFSLCFSYICIT